MASDPLEWPTTESLAEHSVVAQESRPQGTLDRVEELLGQLIEGVLAIKALLGPLAEDVSIIRSRIVSSPNRAATMGTDGERSSLPSYPVSAPPSDLVSARPSEFAAKLEQSTDSRTASPYAAQFSACTSPEQEADVLVRFLESAPTSVPDSFINAVETWIDRNQALARRIGLEFVPFSVPGAIRQEVKPSLQIGNVTLSLGGIRLGGNQVIPPVQRLADSPVARLVNRVWNDIVPGIAWPDLVNLATGNEVNDAILGALAEWVDGQELEVKEEGVKGLNHCGVQWVSLVREMPDNFRQQMRSIFRPMRSADPETVLPAIVRENRGTREPLRLGVLRTALSSPPSPDEFLEYELLAIGDELHNRTRVFWLELGCERTKARDDLVELLRRLLAGFRIAPVAKTKALAFAEFLQTVLRASPESFDSHSEAWAGRQRDFKSAAREFFGQFKLREVPCRIGRLVRDVPENEYYHMGVKRNSSFVKQNEVVSVPVPAMQYRGEGGDEIMPGELLFKQMDL